jgi:hypothetical protein
VLSEYGNMSSPAVWFVLREIENRGYSPWRMVHDVLLLEQGFQPVHAPSEKIMRKKGK